MSNTYLKKSYMKDLPINLLRGTVVVEYVFFRTRFFFTRNTHHIICSCIFFLLNFSTFSIDKFPDYSFFSSFFIFFYNIFSDTPPNLTTDLMVVPLHMILTMQNNIFYDELIIYNYSFLMRPIHVFIDMM